MSALFLAKFLGIFLSVIGLGSILNFNASKDGEKGLANRKGVIMLLVGSLVVAAHSVWISSWAVIITLVGWYLLIIGAMYFLFPILAEHLFSGKQLGSEIRRLRSIVTLILGLVLLYHSYLV